MQLSHQKTHLVVSDASATPMITEYVMAHNHHVINPVHDASPRSQLELSLDLGVACRFLAGRVPASD